LANMEIFNIKSVPSETAQGCITRPSATAYPATSPTRRLTRREKSFLKKGQVTGFQPLNPGPEAGQARASSPFGEPTENFSTLEDDYNFDPNNEFQDDSEPPPQPPSHPLLSPSESVPESEPEVQSPSASEPELEAPPPPELSTPPPAIPCPPQLPFQPPQNAHAASLIHSELDDLPLSTREQIIELVEKHTYEVVTEFVIAPLPQGLGLKTSKSSLKRFVQRYHRGQLKSQREQAAREAAEIAAAADNPETLAAATSHLLRHRLLTLVNVDADPDTLLKYIRALDVLAATTQAERRLRLAESKFAAAQNPK
jgi:hypothetical protein